MLRQHLSCYKSSQILLMIPIFETGKNNLRRLNQPLWDSFKSGVSGKGLFSNYSNLGVVIAQAHNFLWCLLFCKIFLPKRQSVPKYRFVSSGMGAAAKTALTESLAMHTITLRVTDITSLYNSLYELKN